MSQQGSNSRLLDSTLEIYKSEYEKLKEEQLQRILYRDVTIPFSIFIGSAPFISSAFSKDAGLYSNNLLLLVPVICIALGATYVINDERISVIGDYIQKDLRIEIYNLLYSKDVENETNVDEKKKLESDAERFFGWEGSPKRRNNQRVRKISQLFVNLVVFVGSSLTALMVFLFLAKFKISTIAPQVQVIMLFEMAATLFLGICIWNSSGAAPYLTGQKK
jgi:hypothetical protein